MDAEIRNLTLSLESIKKNIDDEFLIISAIIITLMQAGFACLEAGSVRTKNAINIIMKNVLDLFICGVVYYLIGYAVAFGRGSSWLGLTYWASSGLDDSRLAHWFFQFAFTATAATIISGAVAERCNFTAYIVYNAVISGFIYPVLVHWAWTNEGWLNKIGYEDFAGSGVVHAFAGVCSAFAAVFLGPRQGRFTGKKVNELPGHSLILVGIGALLLISGFLAFNGSSLGHGSQPGDGATIARCVINTILSGSGASIVALVLGRLTNMDSGPWPFSTTLNATLAGMVAVCGGPEVYDHWAAIVVGAVGCAMYLCVHHLILFLRIDDPLDATSVHFGAGAWGALARPIFSRQGLILNPSLQTSKAVGANAIGLLAIIVWSAATSFILFGLLKVTGYLRISPEEEIKGVDLSKHGEEAYPRTAWTEWYSSTWHLCFGKSDQMLNGKSPKSEYDNEAFELEKKKELASVETCKV